MIEETYRRESDRVLTALLQEMKHLREDVSKLKEDVAELNAIKNKGIGIVVAIMSIGSVAAAVTSVISNLTAHKA